MNISVFHIKDYKALQLLFVLEYWFMLPSLSLQYCESFALNVAQCLGPKGLTITVNAFLFLYSESSLITF